MTHIFLAISTLLVTVVGRVDTLLNSLTPVYYAFNDTLTLSTTFVSSMGPLQYNNESDYRISNTPTYGTIATLFAEGEFLKNYNSCYNYQNCPFEDFNIDPSCDDFANIMTNSPGSIADKYNSVHKTIYTNHCNMVIDSQLFTGMQNSIMGPQVQSVLGASTKNGISIALLNSIYTDHSSFYSLPIIGPNSLGQSYIYSMGIFCSSGLQPHTNFYNTTWYNASLQTTMIEVVGITYNATFNVSNTYLLGCFMTYANSQVWKCIINPYNSGGFDYYTMLVLALEPITEDLKKIISFSNLYSLDSTWIIGNFNQNNNPPTVDYANGIISFNGNRGYYFYTYKVQMSTKRIVDYNELTSARTVSPEIVSMPPMPLRCQNNLGNSGMFTDRANAGKIIVPISFPTLFLLILIVIIGLAMSMFNDFVVFVSRHLMICVGDFNDEAKIENVLPKSWLSLVQNGKQSCVKVQNENFVNPNEVQIIPIMSYVQAMKHRRKISPA